jgi:hypothetical protein
VFTTEQKREHRKAARDVGEFPKVTRAWRERRKRCAGSLLDFCTTFLRPKFYLAFSADHLRVISKLEEIVLHGGLLAVAMPRGSGKTELVKAAALWAILYGYRKFVVIVGATAGEAVRIMADLKATLAHSDELYAAFPEATHCVRDVAGAAVRARYQTIGGEPSGIEWTRDYVRLAWVKKTASSGAVVRTAGVTGAIRGMSVTGPDGKTLRPDLVLLDDPQDRESATSPVQTDDRERIIRGDVLGLAGPKKTISVAMTVTVICENDLADRFLDREANPQWNGERTRLVDSFPADEVLWEEYFRIRDEALASGGDRRAATRFYMTNWDAMNAGAKVPWADRFDDARYVSALEEAMVRRHDDPEAFAAECQNDPVRVGADRGQVRELHAADLTKRVCNLPRGTVPRGATRLSAFIDVGGRVLWWGVCAFSERFDGWLVDYGAYPRQSRSYFTSDDAHPNLPGEMPGLTEPQLVYAGLKLLTGEILGREYPRDGGGAGLTVQACAVDCGWLPDQVHQFVRESGAHRAVLIPSKGYSTSSNAKSMDEWQRKEGERSGPSWRLGPPPSGRGRQLIFDPDYWKSFLADRLTTPPGGGGAVQFFGDRPAEHRLLADHLTAEYATRVTVRNRTFDKWEQRPGGAENHLLDVLTGCCVAASTLGLAWNPGGPPKPEEPRKRVSLREKFFAKNGGKQ